MLITSRPIVILCIYYILLQVKGGDDIDAPPDGWLVVAAFHTLWSKHSIAIMPALAEVVPLYQDMVRHIPHTLLSSLIYDSTNVSHTYPTLLCVYA